jgi:hypothetical protein
MIRMVRTTDAARLKSNYGHISLSVILEKKEFKYEFLDAHKKLRTFLFSSPPSLNSPTFSTPNYPVPHERFEKIENGEDDAGEEVPQPQNRKHSVSHDHLLGSRISPTVGATNVSATKGSIAVPVTTGSSKTLPADPRMLSTELRTSTMPIPKGAGKSSSVAGDRAQAITRNLTYPLPPGIKTSSRRALEQTDVSGKSMSKEDPALPNVVYRVQGLPTRCKSVVENLLRSVLKLEASITTEIRSLSISYDPDTLVATICLGSTPECLSSSSTLPKDEWRFSYDIPSDILTNDAEEDPINRRCEITFDTHFRGLTILWSPKSSEEHEIE